MDKGGQRAKPAVVVDASVAVKWVVPGEPSDIQATTLGERIASGRAQALAPPLLLYEIASVLLKAVSVGVLEIEDGIRAIDALGRLGLNIATVTWSDLAEMLSMASATGLTAYDSAYLHLSRRTGAPLVTADKSLKRKGEKVTDVILLQELDASDLT